MTKIIATILVLLQILLFIIYFGKFAVKWLNPSSKGQPIWVADRDRVLLFYSITFLFTSSILTKSIEKHSPFFEYFTLILIVSMTAMMVFFYYTKFMAFEPKQHIKKDDKKILISSSFKIKELSKVKLKEIVTPFLQKECFNSELNIFTKIIIENNLIHGKINCIELSKNKTISYSSIFVLMNEITEYGILDLFQDERKSLLLYIQNNFERGKKPIEYTNLEAAFAKWRKNNS